VGKADLHLHSTYSDGSQSVEAILKYVERYTDLDVIAITDHDCIEGALRARLGSSTAFADCSAGWRGDQHARRTSAGARHRAADRS